MENKFDFANEKALIVSYLCDILVTWGFGTAAENCCLAVSENKRALTEMIATMILHYDRLEGHKYEHKKAIIFNFTQHFCDYISWQFSS